MCVRYIDGKGSRVGEGGVVLIGVIRGFGRVLFE